MIRPARIAGVIARAVLAAGASACLALAVHTPAARPAAEMKLVDGTLSQSNSKSGAAILSAHDMRPGDTATGSVTIANTGSASGDFSLSTFSVTDVPGRGGGLLSTTLVAKVLDVTDPSAPRPVYSGTLGAMTPRALGSVGPGAQRVYSFSVGLPATAPALDAAQGGAVTVGYRWDATSASPDPTPTTPPPDTTPPPPPPAVAAPFKLRIVGKSSWSARRRGGPTVTARCTRTCSLRANVRMRGMQRTLLLTVKAKPMASAAGRATRFNITMTKRSVSTIRRALKAHRRVAIAVTVTAVDQNRLTATARKLIRVKR
jgi:spore coat-associated protein N